LTGLTAQQAGAGRSAEYEAPQRRSGVVAGMVCKEGVTAGGATLTVSAHAFADVAAARSHLRQATGRGRADLGDESTGEAVNVAGGRAIVLDSASSSTCYAQDGKRTVVVELRPEAMPVEQRRRDVATIATVLINGMS
jgi:hypothetical protein